MGRRAYGVPCFLDQRSAPLNHTICESSPADYTMRGFLPAKPLLTARPCKTEDIELPRFT